MPQQRACHNACIFYFTGEKMHRPTEVQGAAAAQGHIRVGAAGRRQQTGGRAKQHRRLAPGRPRHIGGARHRCWHRERKTCGRLREHNTSSIFTSGFFPIEFFSKRRHHFTPLRMSTSC